LLKKIKFAMKTKGNFLKAALVLFVSTVIFLTACKKDSTSSGGSTTDTNNASNLSANGAAADNAYDDAFNVALQTSSDQNLNSIIMNQSGIATNGVHTVTGINGFYCATVSVSGTAFPITVTVDFGSGCTSADSITRSGSITYVFSGKLSTPGTTISATFNNYVVNGYQLGGTYSITNSSSLTSLSLTTSITGGTIVYPNDSSYSFSGSKVVSLVLPADTVHLLDNQFSITGGYTISNTNTGESLTATVTTPLIKAITCKHIISGILAFAYTKGSLSLNGTLNYGDGTCDNSAVVTIGAVTKTITLP
jgi:hypothetical protein